VPRGVSAVRMAMPGVLAIASGSNGRWRGHRSSGRRPEDAVRAVGPIIRPLAPRTAPNLR
jgi:hypothetical protein